MVRRFAEPVFVRQVASADGQLSGGQLPGGQLLPGAPEAFVWRDRLYVVREVLDHWRERTAWWRADAARAVHGEQVAGRHRRESDPAEAAARSAELAAERRVWRVEASPGMAHPHGVYDLCQDVVPDPDRAPAALHAVQQHDVASGTWRLLRVSD